MKPIYRRPWCNVLAFAFAIALNTLANILPMNGLTTGQVSDSFAVYFVPAGYVFAIWGLIYVALLAFIVYQALPAQRDDAELASIDGWFVVSCLANGIWIPLWHYKIFVWTVPVMLLLLVSLIAIYLRLDIGRRAKSGIKKWLLQVPFSIYLGWITVATVANVTDVLSYLRWNGWGIAPQTWAVVMLLVAAAIALVVNWTRADVGYVLVIAWAFVGIAVKQYATKSVAYTAVLLAIIVTLPLVSTVPRLRRLPGRS